MLSVAPALANIAGAAAAAWAVVSAALPVVSLLAFSPDEQATANATSASEARELNMVVLELGFV
jgi:hypothetical protein